MPEIHFWHYTFTLGVGISRSASEIEDEFYLIVPDYRSRIFVYLSMRLI